MTEYTWRSRARYRVKRIMDELKDLKRREQQGGRSLSRKQLEHWYAKSKSHLRDSAKNGSIAQALEVMVHYAQRVRRGERATDVLWEIEHPEEMAERAAQRQMQGTQDFLDALRKLNIGLRVLRPPRQLRGGGTSRTYSAAQKAEQLLIIRGVLTRPDVQLVLQYQKAPAGITEAEWENFTAAVKEAATYVGQVKAASAVALAEVRAQRAAESAAARATHGSELLEQIAAISAATGVVTDPADAALEPAAGGVVSVIREHPVATAGAAVGLLAVIGGAIALSRRGK